MSDKSEIEAIRARDAGRKYVTGIIEAQVWQDRRALLSHVDALEARVRAAEELLRKMRRLDINLHSVDKNEIDAYFAGVKHE